MVWSCLGGARFKNVVYMVKGFLNKEGCHSILQLHVIACGQLLTEANFFLQQDID